MIGRILSLEPLGFDTAPVFELCWRLTGPDQTGPDQTSPDQSADNQIAASRKILSLIPKRGHKPVEYLEFLIMTRRADAALDAWPSALAAADPANSSDLSTLTGFADFLTGADRMTEAMNVWNQLVERGMIHAGRLDPAKGVSIADPDFRFPPTAKAFGWRTAEIPGVFVSGFSGSLRLEINGDEPQSFQVLSTLAPVLAGTPYHLRWKSDGSSLSSPRDPGFSFLIVQQHILQQPSDVTTQCPPLLSPRNPPCDFVTSAGSGPERMGEVRIDLRYTRATGTTRVSGTLQLFDVHLEIAR